MGVRGKGFWSAAVFETPAVVAGLDDVAVMGDAIEHGGGHFGVVENGRPFTEGEVGGDDYRSLFVELADQVKQQLATSQSEGKITQLVQDDEVEAGELARKRSGFADPGLLFEAIDQIDGVEEAASGPGAHDGGGDRERKMGLAGACRSSFIMPAIIVAIALSATRSTHFLAGW